MADDDRLTAELEYLTAVATTAQSHPEAFDFAVLMPRFGRALAALDAVLELADGASADLRFSPADCTNACSDGPCNCSGETRAAAWDLDPAKVREAITREVTGEGDDE